MEFSFGNEKEDNSFNTGINVNAHKNIQDSKSIAAADLVGGGIAASVVDFGASVWNSLPGTPEVSTYDILKRIGGSPLAVYEEHSDAVHTASFIGGIFVPSGLALKGMNAMRAGAKGINWFSTGARSEDLAKITAAVNETRAYRDVTRGIYAKTALNQALDAIAMETAVVMTMNAHPFMEDYMKDPISNFAIGALIGGGLGAGIGLIADRALIKATAGAAEAEVFQTVAGTIRAAEEGYHNVMRLHAHEATIKNLEEITKARKDLGKTTENDLLLHTADAFLLNVKAEQVKLFEEIADPSVLKLPKKQQEKIMRIMLENDAFKGVEDFRLLSESIATAEKKVSLGTKSTLEAEPTLFKNTSSKGPTKLKTVEAVYYPEHGLFGNLKDAFHYAGVSALGKNLKTLVKELPRNYGKGAVTSDPALELLHKSAATMEGEYFAALKWVDDLDGKKLEKVTVDAQDGPLLSALIAKMKKDPTLASVEVGVTGDLSTYSAMAAKSKTVRAELRGALDNKIEVAGKALTMKDDEARTLARKLVGKSAFDSFVNTYAAKTADNWNVFNDVEIAKRIITFYEGQPVRAAFPELKKATLKELENLYLAQKQDAIESLIISGVPFASIAIRTNTPVELVEKYALFKEAADLSDFIKLDESVLSLNKVKSIEEAEKVLEEGIKPIVLKTSLIKNPVYVQNATALDFKAARILNKEFTALTLLGSKSQTAKEIGHTFFGPPGESFGTVVDIIAAKIGQINPSNAGNPFFQSFDFFTRYMKDVGPAVSAIGKRVESIAANTIHQVMEPIETAMVAVQKDAAALVEFSTFYNVNASLKGWRKIDDEGFLVQKVASKDELGKDVTTLQRVKYTTVDGTVAEYQIKTKAVRELLDAMQAQSFELKALHNTVNRIKGTPDISDIGLWVPSFNPIDKHIAYVHNRNTHETKLLWARNEKEFREQLRAYKEEMYRQGMDPLSFEIITDGKLEIKEIGVAVNTKDQQAKWNLLNGRLDPIHMERADVGMQKGGTSAAAISKPDISLFGEIAKGYEFYITSQVRNLADLTMHEVTDSLRRMSEFNKRNYAKQPFSSLKKMVSKPADPAAIMRNTLLGNNNLGEYAGWQTLNKGFEVTLSMAMTGVSKAYEATLGPVFAKVKSKDGMIDLAGKKLPYKELNQELEKQGIIYPWKNMDEERARELGFFSFEAAPDSFKRLVYGSNALAATLALRFLEAAQPLVNAISMPVLTGLAIAQRQPESFLGVAKSSAAVMPAQIMHEGVARMWAPQAKYLNDKWAAAGYFKPVVSEASDIMRATHKFDKGPIAAVENMIDSKLVEFASKPADVTESITRKAAMNMGYVLGKRLYPELDDVGLTIFARDFMDKAIGNFHASQRPVMYQGTLGVALGLFQTYMWTMGQNIYRHLEGKNYKALFKAGLTQSSLFGLSSLPGFDQLNSLIGDRFSDQNYDLVTGTYRATGDKLGDLMLYGLPSNLGPTISTRGDINPRFPNVLGGVDNIVAVNVLNQSMLAVANVAKSVQYDGEDIPRAMMQALSLQTISRPIARSSELLMSQSITRPGNTVQTSEEVWSFQGVAARLLATRPIEEQKLRDADHLNHFYNALDRDAREELYKKMRTSIRAGTFDDEKLAAFSELYFRKGGNPAGWRSVVNRIVATTEEPGREVFLDKLKPDSPFHHMIDSLER